MNNARGGEPERGSSGETMTKTTTSEHNPSGAEQLAAADAFQPPLRARFQAQLRPGVRLQIKTERAGPPPACLQEGGCDRMVRVA
jgi:hypothetical protein